METARRTQKKTDGMDRPLLLSGMIVVRGAKACLQQLVHEHRVDDLVACRLRKFQELIEECDLAVVVERCGILCQPGPLVINPDKFVAHRAEKRKPGGWARASLASLSA